MDCLEVSPCFVMGVWGISEYYNGSKDVVGQILHWVSLSNSVDANVAITRFSK